jgi:uncharacterized protein
VAVQVSYPGVYIDEFEPGAPIEGVGTSTAAFIGPAALGELDIPTKITSWDLFLATYGNQPLPGYYMWYAVRGFFRNGGQVCYIVRASNGDYGEVLLPDQSGNNILRVRALKPGLMAAAPPSIQVDVVPVHLLASADTSLYQPTSNYTVTAAREIQLPNATDAAMFKPGDWVDLGGAGTRLQILRVNDDRIRVSSDLAAVVGANGTIRLADAPAGTATTVRIAYNKPNANSVIPDGALVAGSVLTITQGANSDTQVVDSFQAESIDPTNPNLLTYRVTFRQGLDSAFSMDPANTATVQSEEFHFRVLQGASATQYDNLSMDPAHPRYFVTYVNQRNQVVRLKPIEPPPSDPLPGNLLATTGGPVPLAGGADENLSTLAAVDYIQALSMLEQIDDVNLVASPDAVTLRTAAGVSDVAGITAVQQAIRDHCELIGDRFAILDPRPGLPLFGTINTDGIDTQRRSLDSTRGYAALYYPWLRVQPAGPGAPILVPPSGHVCGIIAHSDNTRGVFKAPANENVNDASGVERTMSDIEQGQLNLLGINVIRVFQAGGQPQLWGARTTATNKSWLHVSTRRLFLFLEESIQEGIRWAVFEPNNTGLWQMLRRTIRAFLIQQWRDGALFGNTADEAFYVRIDDVLNPFSEQALGRLHIEIGVRPSYPAEFIILRIGIWQGGAQVEEA